MPPPKVDIMAKKVLEAFKYQEDLPAYLGAFAHNFDTTSGSFFVTGARPYLNGAPHVGHVYEAVVHDVLARFHRLDGKKVIQGLGADEHGEKVEKSAAARGLSPLANCDEIFKTFQAIYQRTNISLDCFTRLSSDQHTRYAQTLWRKCQENGDIYLDHYDGWYLPREERYVTDREAEEWEFKDPESGVDLERKSEESYFFRMSKYQTQLIKLLEGEYIQPEKHRAVLLDRLRKDELRDLSISRNTLKWGIPVEGSENHVMYVWFDALTSYLTDISYFEDPESGMWPCNAHVIGKDISWFHCVIWPAMLMSAGLPLPKHVLVHGFVHGGDGRKMSKSLGNVLDPWEFCNEYAVDSLRWYLMREAALGSDLTFSVQNVTAMHNADLCNNLGNLVQRSMKLSGGQVAPFAPTDIPLPFDVDEAVTSFRGHFARFELTEAANVARTLGEKLNKWIHEQEPWKLKDEIRKAQVIRMLLEGVYVVAHFFGPFVPETADHIFKKLATPPVPLEMLDTRFSKNLADGTPLVAGNCLFAKIEVPSDKPAPKKAPKETPTLPVDDPRRLEIRVGQITKVWEHPDADSLWVEEIDLGTETRTICSGLRAFYTADQMLNARVLVLCNLKPRKLRGINSHGMVLCAGHQFVEGPGNPGDLVYFEGLTSLDSPAFDKEMPSKEEKNPWFALCARMTTNSEGTPAFDGAVWKTSSGVCQSPAADAKIA